MGLFEHWPYTNFHDLNLNWIISKIKDIDAGIKGAEDAASEASSAAETASEAAEAAANAAESAAAAAGPLSHAAELVNVLGAQMNEFIASESGSRFVTDLYTAESVAAGLHYRLQTAILSDDPSNYDAIQVNYSHDGVNEIHTFSPDDLTDPNRGAQIFASGNQGGSSANMCIRNIALVQNTGSAANEYIIVTARQINWSGVAADPAAVTSADTSSSYAGGTIVGIKGIKYSEDAELADLRVGANGTVYQTAGDAVRSQLSSVTKKMALVLSDNKWDPNNTKSGYMAANGTEGANASYEHLNDPIPVSEGDIVRSYEINAGGGFATAGMRWLCAMDADKNAVAASGSNANITSYTVPQGIAYINPTMNIGGQKRMITINLEATTFIDYTDPYYVATPEFTGIIDIDSDTTFKNEYMNGELLGLLDPAECVIGKYLNPSTGAISDNASYYITDYIPIKNLQTLYFYQKDNKNAVSARTIAAYDADKNLLDTKGATNASSYTQSATVAFIRCCFNYYSSDIVRTPYGISIMANSDPAYVTGYGGNETIKSEYLRPVFNVRTTDTEEQIIEKFVKAFEIGGCDVVFERGNYSFGPVLAVVKDTFHLFENEIPVGNNCRYFFNGSTLSASIDLSTYGTDYLCNFIGTQKRPSSFEMYDGLLIANDTVYVMHDESDSKQGTYKHIYQNMEMQYITTRRTDNIRKCIGGGTGASGVVEIVGCKFTTDGTSECVAFHGNGTDVSGAAFDINVRNSWFSNGIRVNQMSTGQTARFLYAGNSAASAPVTGDRVTLTEFCNVTR